MYRLRVNKHLEADHTILLNNPKVLDRFVWMALVNL